MKKDFRSAVIENKGVKKEQNIFLENNRLKDKVKTLENDVSHLREMIAQSENNKETTFIELDRVKIQRNIRKTYQYEQIEELKKDIVKNGQLQAVTLTSDDVLVSGHRRYLAMKELKKHIISCVHLDNTFSEIGKETFDRMQLAENEQRKELDNLDISDLFNEYIKEGRTQKELTQLFNKPKSVISELVSLNKISPEIRALLKEIQFYGMSKRKFTSANFNIEDIKPTIIGRNTLIKISNTSSLDDQFLVFIDLFGNKLHKDDFKDLGINKPIKNKESITFKYIQRSNKQLKSLRTKFKDNKKALIVIDEVEKLQEEINKKLSILEIN